METQSPEAEAIPVKALVLLIDMPDNQIGVEMRLPEGQEKIDEGSPAQLLMAWLATNWESIMTMFNYAMTAHAEKKADEKIDEFSLLEPQTPKLVAADGKSLIQH